MKILVEYDERHSTNFINIDKIYMLSKLNNLVQHYITKSDQNFQNSIEFLLRKKKKKGILPLIPSICTTILEKNHTLYKRILYCKTCRNYEPICEGHLILETNNCKCKSISENVHEELYDNFNVRITVLF